MGIGSFLGSAAPRRRSNAGPRRRFAALALLACLLLGGVVGTAALAVAPSPERAHPVLLADASQGSATDATKAEGSSPKAAAAEEATPEEKSAVRKWLEKLAPIFILLVVIGIVLERLPRIELGHSEAFLKRRLANWLPLGLTYSFLYMGRYNLNVALGTGDFSAIFAAGTVTYGISFVINGPLTDRLGGRFAILLGAFGAAAMNLLMGLFFLVGPTDHKVLILSVLYAANMYFQSFGAVAIVKVNAPWFHVRERGVFGAIFGILISLGIYFAFDWSKLIKNAISTPWVFFAPAIILTLFAIVDIFKVKDTPGKAGFEDFDTEDASSGDTGPALSVVQVFKKMLMNPIIMTIAAIEFCSGFLRQAIMQYGPKYAGAVGEAKSFVFSNWGLLLCCAGILGGVVAGVISDRVFGSRRGPVAALLYGVMLAGGIAIVVLLGSPLVGWLVIVMSMAIIGVHGMLSGTASMDFGGKKNVGIAVGIIDGFVYLGTGFMSLVYLFTLPKAGADASPSAWIAWPVAMVPMAIIGLVLTMRIWHAMPKGKGGGAAPAPDVSLKGKGAVSGS